MTKPPLHEEAERLILNTGPLIALGRIDALEIVSRLPLTFTTPVQVAEEIATGISPSTVEGIHGPA